MQHLDPDLRALQDVRDAVARAQRACRAVHGYDQRRTDALCAAMAKAGAAAAHDLARLAVEETGIGKVHYKVLKNLFGSEGTWASIANEKTVGILSRDERSGIVEVGTASGVVAGIVPTTNPTSTTLYKAIIAVKGRNAIVISPHPRARRCIGETVDVLRRAIERAGGPPDLVCCLPNPTIESTGALMRHKDVALILATGGTGLVTAAYSSGRPAYGVGPGNVPCYVDRSADVPYAAAAITASQSFDNATLCCSEQGLVLDQPIAKQLVAELVKRGAHVCDEDETKKLAKLCNVRGHMNGEVVGLDPWRIAEMAGFAVPQHTTLLLAWQGGVGRDWPLSIEILAPVLSLHLVDGWEQGCRVSIAMLESDGLGHTLGIHAKDERVLEAFFLEKPANRIVVNGPCSQGAVGYSTHLVPSFSLGCGPQAGNITSDNISARHLINVKRVAFPRRDWAELERRDHERAAAMTRDGMPRGSGMPGDPALEGAAPRPSSSARSPDASSNWRGNPAFGASTSAATSAPPVAAPVATPWASKVGAGAKSAPPTFTAPRSAASAVPSAAASAAATAASAALLARPAPAPRAAVAQGSGLSTAEIQTLLSHAGTGCPLGPCKGCPHHEVTTGACQA
ncbi:MAG: aldehyde dehydrogenase family protein [Planctomycetes bacterium]|nr:aldehyde dehydrogenase family protein [Planctomycetota bacterium]